MTAPTVGEKIKVRHVNDQRQYTLDVEVTAILTPDEFVGRIERVFAADVERGEVGEITGGCILALKGQEKEFKNENIVR